MSTFVRTMKTLSAALVLGATLGAAGCGGTVSDPDDQTAAQQAARRSGALGRFSAVLAEIELRADQRAVVDGLLDGIERQAEPVRTAKEKVALELAAEVRAGRIDRAKIDPLLEALAQAAESLAPTIESSANKLHTTLDASQREDLVDTLRDRAMERRGGRGDKMRRMAEDLALSSEQKGQIFEAIKAEMGKDRESMRARFREAKEKMENLAEAFQSDSFDARAFDAKTRAAEMVRGGGDRIVKMVEVALPILTADQRTKLADVIERRAKDVDE